MPWKAQMNFFFFYRYQLNPGGFLLPLLFWRALSPRPIPKGGAEWPSTVALLATHVIVTCHICEGHCHILFFFYQAHVPHLLFS